jgi:genome maintenance exonuclease 1
MGKSFQHEFLPHIPLTEEMVDGKRYYTTVDGERFPSITTVLKSMSAAGIAAWTKRVGTAEANKVKTQAAGRGKHMHALCEAYLLNQDPPADASLLSREMFKSVKPFLSHVDKVWGIELPLYSKKLGIAGRTDAYVQIKGRNAILDYKTSAKEKKAEWITNYLYQTTAYSIMIEELYGHRVDDIVIVIAIEHEDKPQVFAYDARKYRPKFTAYLDEIGHEHTYK